MEIQIQVSTPDRAIADRIANHLVANRLAACVQILSPMTSVYQWNGQIETAEEFLCLIKTTEAIYQEVEDAIVAFHPYETPEIIATKIIMGLPSYLKWIESNVGSSQKPKN